MKRLVFLLLFISTSSFASIDTEVATVKVISDYTKYSYRMMGSGFLFNYKKETYVLTSEHVIYHENLGMTHQIYHSDHGSIEAQYLVSDWGNGIALLKLSKYLTVSGIPELSELAVPKSLKNKDLVDLFGYPASSFLLQEVYDGVVAGAFSTSKVLADVSNMIEIEDAQGEFGMSGGVAFNSQLDFIGLISHQKLNASNIPGPWSPGDLPFDNKILLVPGSVVLSWVQSYLDHPKTHETKLFKEVNLQIQTHWEVAQSLDLIFSYTDIYGQPPYVNIGYYRRDGANSIWNDAAGILKEIRNQLEIYENAAPKVYASYSVIGFRKVSSPGNYHWSISKAITRFMDFFEFMEDPAYEPIVRLEGNYMSAEVDKLVKIGNQLNSAISYTQSTQLEKDLKRLSDLVTAKDITGWESAGYWKYVRLKDLNELMNDSYYAKDWASLKKNKPTQYNDIKNKLTLLTDQMKRMVF